MIPNNTYANEFPNWTVILSFLYYVLIIRSDF
jgi:hypothetical protein